MSKAIDKDRIIKEMKENLKMAQSTIKEKDALISLYEMWCEKGRIDQSTKNEVSILHKNYSY